MEAKQICSVCGNEFVIKDIELYMQKINESWDIIKSQFEYLPEEQQKEIKERNKNVWYGRATKEDVGRCRNL